MGAGKGLGKGLGPWLFGFERDCVGQQPLEGLHIGDVVGDALIDGIDGVDGVDGLDGDVRSMGKVEVPAGVKSPSMMITMLMVWAHSKK